MPVDWSRYPDDWEAISAAIRERAGNRCERCGVVNGAWRAWWSDKDGPGFMIYRYAEQIDGVWYGWNEQTAGGTWTHDPDALDRKPSRIVLTVAHVHDPDPQNCDPANLQALCQLCHNRLDAPMRARNAAATRRRKAIAATGQGELEL